MNNVDINILLNRVSQLEHSVEYYKKKLDNCNLKCVKKNDNVTIIIKEFNINDLKIIMKILR